MNYQKQLFMNSMAVKILILTIMPICLSKKLCHISQLPEFLCTMQDLLYRTPDPHNVAYLRKYLSAMPGKIPDLVRERLEQLNV